MKNLIVFVILFALFACATQKPLKNDVADPVRQEEIARENERDQEEAKGFLKKTESFIRHVIIGLLWGPESSDD